MELIEKFEIIFDRATSESMAKKNALDYYMMLLEDDIDEDVIDVSEIINVAESYGYNFDDFEDLIRKSLE